MDEVEDARGGPLTVRQHIMQLLALQSYSARDLAHHLRVPERQSEKHLEHIARTVARDRSRRLIRQPSTCEHCGFVFRSRTRMTRPGRCPRCRSERISPPRYGITMAGPSERSPGES